MAWKLADLVALALLQLATVAAAAHVLQARRVTPAAAAAVAVALIAAARIASPADAHARLVRVEGAGITAVGGDGAAAGSAGQVGGGGGAAGGQGVRVGYAGAKAGGGVDLSFAFQGGFSAFDSGAEAQEVARANAEALRSFSLSGGHGGEITEEDFDDIFDAGAGAGDADRTAADVSSGHAPTPTDGEPRPGSTAAAERGTKDDAGEDVSVSRASASQGAASGAGKDEETALAAASPADSVPGPSAADLEADSSPSSTSGRGNGNNGRSKKGRKRRKKRKAKGGRKATDAGGGGVGGVGPAPSLVDLTARLGLERTNADMTGAGISGEDFYDGAMMEDVVTSFDYLQGMAKRKEHPDFQEVEIVALFESRGGVDVVRRELEAEIVQVGHNTLDAWPKWSRLGNTWRATGNINRAMQCFRKALHIKSTDPDVLLNLAVVLQNLRYLDDAEILIREAVKLHPNGVLHHFILGNIQQLQGLEEDAIRSYEHALRLQPDFLPCEKKLEELRPRRVHVQPPPQTLWNVVVGYLGYIIGAAMVLAALCRRAYDGQDADEAALAAAREHHQQQHHAAAANRGRRRSSGRRGGRR